MKKYYLLLFFLIIIQDFRVLVSNLPESDKPSFFGLPANIDRSKQRTVGNQVGHI